MDRAGPVQESDRKIGKDLADGKFLLGTVQNLPSENVGESAGTRQLQPGILPDVRAKWQLLRVEQARDQAWDDYDYDFVLQNSGEGADVIRFCSFNGQRNIVSAFEESATTVSKFENPPNQIELAAAILVVVKEIGVELGIRFGCLDKLHFELAENLPANFVGDWPPIIRVHEIEIPQLGSLIKIRHARRSHFQQDLSEGIDAAEESDFPLKRFKVVEK